MFLGDDSSAAIVPPFPIEFGGVSFNTLYVSSNGTVNVTGPNNDFENSPLPTTKANTLVALLWDDLYTGPPASNVFWDTTGVAPHRELVVEWRDVSSFACFDLNGTGTVKFQAVFFEGSSNILFNYADATFGGACAAVDGGAAATIGIQTSPAVARQYSHNSASVTDGSALLWTCWFTDDPLIAGVTPVKAVHITELRARINTQRVRAGLAGT